MAITQKKDGRWCVYYRNPKTEKQKWEYFGRGVEAEKKARQRNEKLGFRAWESRTPKESSPLFFELVNAYVEAKSGKIEKSSFDNFSYKMRGVLLPELGQTPAIKLTPHRLDQYVAKRLKADRRIPIRYGSGKQFLKYKTVTGPDGKPSKIKRTTVNREVSDVIAVLNWAVGQKYLTHNPAAGYKKPKRDDEIIAPPTTEEIRQLFKHSPPHLIRALILSFFTETRPGKVELLGLKWSDIDFDAKTIFVRSARKNGLISRTVPLNWQFVDLLKSWYEQDANDNSAEYIIHYRGRPVNRIIKAFQTAKKRPESFGDFGHTISGMLLLHMR
jgi:integrase